MYRKSCYHYQRHNPVHINWSNNNWGYHWSPYYYNWNNINWNYNWDTNYENIELRDYGSKPFVVNIDQATKQNNTFRTALWTGKNL